MLTRTDQFIINLKPRFREASIHGAIWAFIGLLYAVLFTSFASFAENFMLPMKAYFFAGIMTGAISALMYSSMRLVVFISMLLFPIGMVIFNNTIGNSTLLDMLKFMLPAGLVVGAVYGLFSKRSQIGHADAKTLAGLSAGFLVSLVYLLIQSFFPSISIMWIVGIMSLMTGALYMILAPVFIHLYHDLLPPVGDGALVGAAVSVFISFSLFVMAGSIDTFTTGELVPEIITILELLPDAAFGGLVGSGLAGFITGFVFCNWEDEEND